MIQSRVRARGVGAASATALVAAILGGCSSDGSADSTAEAIVLPSPPVASKSLPPMCQDLAQLIERDLKESSAKHCRVGSYKDRHLEMLSVDAWRPADAQRERRAYETEMGAGENVSPDSLLFRLPSLGTDKIESSVLFVACPSLTFTVRGTIADEAAAVARVVRDKC